MNTIRTALVIIVTTFVLSGCDFFGATCIATSTIQEKVETATKKMKEERDAARTELAELKKNLPKGEVITTGIPLASCQTMIQEAVVKNCQAKTTQPVQTKRLRKTPPFVNKQEARGKTLPPAPPEVPVTKSGENSPGGEICRLRSDGTARLLSAPSVVLARGYVIATNLPDPESPNAQLLRKAANEDCVTWRKWVGDKLVDKTDGSGRK
jgi:hypothetical protein